MKPNRRWLRICTNLAAAQMCSDNPVPVQMWQGVPSPGAAATSTYRTARLGAVPVSLVQCYEYMGQLRRRGHCLARHRPAPLSAAKGSPHPRLPTARDRSQAHTRHLTNSAAHPGCRGLVKRQAAPYLQLRVGRPRHTRTQLTRCRAASMPNGLRLLQGACEPSRSMFPLRARATRVRGVPRPCRASKCSPLPAGAGAGAGGDEPSKGPSVLGRRASCRVHAARRALTKDTTRRRQRA